MTRSTRHIHERFLRHDPPVFGKSDGGCGVRSKSIGFESWSDNRGTLIEVHKRACHSESVLWTKNLLTIESDASLRPSSSSQTWLLWCTEISAMWAGYEKRVSISTDFLSPISFLKRNGDHAVAISSPKLVARNFMIPLLLLFVVLI